jgi:hypothetical protein
MLKRKRVAPVRTEPDSALLLGLRAHAQAQKQGTVERLRSAITSLQVQHKPISARTIYEECGLEYAYIRRNPEALLLYQLYITFLKRELKRTRTAGQTPCLRVIPCWPTKSLTWWPVFDKHRLAVPN